MDGACGTYGVNIRACWVLVGKYEGKRPSEDLGVGGKLLLKWLLKKCYLRASYCLFGVRT